MKTTSAIRTHRDLLVWQRAMDLAERCYDISNTLPKSELYCLGSQIRRACVSIPANIAEGHGRHHLGDYLRHLSFAMGSLMELDTEVRLAARRRFIDASTLEAFLVDSDEVGRLLRGLMKALQSRRIATPNT